MVQFKRFAYLRLMTNDIVAPRLEAAATGEQDYWQAVVNRDSSQDGVFVFAVSTTGVYCRPSCPAKRPYRANVSFYLTTQEAERAGYRACLRCRPRGSLNRQLERIREICRYIEGNLDQPLTLERLARAFHQSAFHLQRTFKSVLGITPHAYAESCRMTQLKRNLQAGHSVTRAMYDAGYSSSSRLYERTSSHLGMTPDKYRRGAIAARIRYTIAGSPLGRLLVAATDKGLCAIQFGNSDEELEQGLKLEFPFADRRREDEGLRLWKQALLEGLRGHRPHSALPLDIQATAFQRRVWEYLQTIPYGSTRSYSEVACAIGRPKATRAVAQACAANPIALAIPCHRVIAASGELGGFRWGVQRKQQLLELEKSGRSRLRAAARARRRPLETPDNLSPCLEGNLTLR